MTQVFPLGSHNQLDARTMRDRSPSCNFTAYVLCLQQLEETFVLEKFQKQFVWYLAEFQNIFKVGMYDTYFFPIYPQTL